MILASSKKTIKIDLINYTYQILFQSSNVVSTIYVANSDIENTIKELKASNLKEVK